VADEAPAEAPKEAPKTEDMGASKLAAAKAAIKEDEKSVDTLAKGDGKTMHVKVYAPFKTYYDGIAHSVSAVNDTGPFDILPRHHNFMTLINQGDILIRTEDDTEEKIPINKGVMHVKADQVVVFLDV
jgi:hypothetical protein